MTTKLRALVISPDAGALRHIQKALRSVVYIELAMSTDGSFSARRTLTPHVLILHCEAAADRLRQLRLLGYDQPALILNIGTKAAIVPLEDDLGPIENVTWAVLRSGGLLRCIDSLLNPAIYWSAPDY